MITETDKTNEEALTFTRNRAAIDDIVSKIDKKIVAFVARFGNTPNVIILNPFDVQTIQKTPSYVSYPLGFVLGDRNTSFYTYQDIAIIQVGFYEFVEVVYIPNFDKNDTAPTCHLYFSV
jgi:hypothetical protein